MKHLILALLVIAAFGCGSEPTADPKVEADRLQGAQDMRSYYDKVKGDYSKLAGPDREAYLKLFNGKEEDAQRMWGMMGQRGLGGGSPSAPGGSPPPPNSGG